jgi:hypothetical protein
MRNAAGTSVIFQLAILLVLVPVTYIGSFVVFSYATDNIRDGGWALVLVDHLARFDSGMLNLLGARSRFVWSALTVLFALTMVSAGAFSLVVLARRAVAHKTPILVAIVLFSVALGVAAWVVGPSQFWGCAFDPCGEACATKSTGKPFLIIPYMGAIFCRIYEPSFLAFFWRFFTVAGAVQTSINALFVAAALSLIVGPRSIERSAIADLRQRISDFRALLILASVILTLAGLTELTLWGWLAEIAAGWQLADKLRSLQVGSALYWGICNSVLMLLVFAPLGSVLAKEARALARSHNEGTSIPALETWEREQGVTLLGRAAWPQVVGILAPLLTGALTFLFQTTLGGG